MLAEGAAGGAPRRRRVLTVGDGDLSYSLALARALGDSLSLTATVLPSAEELCRTYASTAATLAELSSRGVAVLHGVDATRLEHAGLGTHDDVVFNHPHLGPALFHDAAAHAARHAALLAHFLLSARRVLAAGGRVRLTLCGNQPVAWAVEASASRLGLRLLSRRPPAAWGGGIAPPREEWRAARRYRNGALGSKHWLGKYGYAHRRCEGDGAMDVEGAEEFVFCAAEGWAAAPPPPPPCCEACALSFESEEELARHAALTLPDDLSAPRAWVCEATGRAFASAYALQTFTRQREALPSPRQREAPPAEARPAAAAAEEVASLEPLRRVVPAGGAGQRLSRWVRLEGFPSQLPSKKFAEEAIKQGRVRLRGEAAEGARVLAAGDEVELLHDPRAVTRCGAGVGVELVREEAEAAVAWKPVGLRACGDFAATLQGALRALLPAAEGEGALACAVPLSRVEIGCGGLCVVGRTERGVARLDGKVRHAFVALAHGRMPEEWRRGGAEVRFTPLPFQPQRMKRRAARKAARGEAAGGEGSARAAAAAAEEEEEEAEEAEAEEARGEEGGDGDEQQQQEEAKEGACAEPLSAWVEAVEVTSLDSPVALSTVRFTSDALRGRLCGDLCYFLRAAGFPVVGDRYAKRESGRLPRCCASLKAKLQVGCYGVRAPLVAGQPDEWVSRPLPARLLASHWEALAREAAAAGAAAPALRREALGAAPGGGAKRALRASCGCTRVGSKADRSQTKARSV